MSTKYTGGFITKSPVAPTTSAASGIWTLDQQQQAQKAGTWPSPPNFIEDVFSTYLYTGTGASQTITNGIDLSGKGGLVWLKIRNGTGSNRLVDTVRGGGNVLTSNATNANVYDASIVPTFSSSGFDTGGGIDISSYNYVSWTFREQPKFFDVVTYTGNGTSQNIAHNLGSVPGCIMVKRTDAVGNWIVWHRSLNQQTGFINLESTAASSTNIEYWDNTAPTSSVFSVGPISGTNGSGATYVAYIFAHNAGGFGLTGTDNVISCGSFSGNTTVTLGYEPQWVLLKSYDAVDDWYINDNMRGWTNDGANGKDAYLRPNSSGAEVAGNSGGFPTATGFTTWGFGGTNGIYIAIRRGPMKTPTVGTSVFSPVAYTGDGGSPKAINAGFVADAAWGRGRTDTFNWNQVDRLRGSPRLSSNATSAEATSLFGNPTWDTMTGLNGVNGGTDNSNYNQSSMGYIFDVFKRAPGFFDVVCYTGTGVARTVTHNLGVAPQLLIVKDRTPGGNEWAVYASPLGNLSALSLNRNYAAGPTAIWNSTTPTSSVFSVSDAGDVNGLNYTLVAYLFATVAGVSKVGSYTGTGALQTINCAFTTGARFVLVKRTDSTGSWYVWDSARGITAGNDPYLLINSTAAEVTSTNYVDTDTTGFKVTAAAPDDINASGGTFIFLAIA